VAAYSPSAGSMLTSTAERDRAVDALRAAFAEGRLTQEEFTERVAQVHASRTFDQLAELLCDLPPAYPPASHSPEPEQPLRRRPSPAGLAMTALVVFAFAALVTAVALIVHAHAVQMSPAVDQCREPAASRHLAPGQAPQIYLEPCVIPQPARP
jgi:hypothetical protein